MQQQPHTNFHHFRRQCVHFLETYPSATSSFLIFCVFSKRKTSHSNMTADSHPCNTNNTSMKTQHTSFHISFKFVGRSSPSARLGQTVSPQLPKGITSHNHAHGAWRSPLTSSHIGKYQNQAAGSTCSQVRPKQVAGENLAGLERSQAHTQRAAQWSQKKQVKWTNVINSGRKQHSWQIHTRGVGVRHRWT